jgi:hypothetical protein
MDDFELSAEDLQAIEKVEKARPRQPSARKRQTPSPIDFDLEDDALMELERIEHQQQSKAAKRPLLAAPSAPVAKITKPPAIARVPPVQQPVKIAPQQSKVNNDNIWQYIWVTLWCKLRNSKQTFSCNICFQPCAAHASLENFKECRVPQVAEIDIIVAPTVFRARHLVEERLTGTGVERKSHAAYLLIILSSNWGVPERVRIEPLPPADEPQQGWNSTVQEFSWKFCFELSLSITSLSFHLKLTDYILHIKP